MLDACEFLRVGNDANRRNMPCLHLNGQHEQGLTTGADDDSRLTIDLCQLHTIVLWQKAHRSQAKARNCITPDKRTKRGLFDFPTGISPQGHIFGEQVHQGDHITTLSRLQKAGEQLLMDVWRGREAWSMLSQMVLRPAERPATGRFTLAKHGGNLGKLILEDFAQQENSSLEGLELLQQHQERQRDRLIHIDALCRIDCFGSHGDRKSTRLNSSHTVISYAVFCLKKKKKHSNSSHHDQR